MDDAERFVRDLESFENRRRAPSRVREYPGECWRTRAEAALRRVKSWFHRPDYEDPYAYVTARLIPRQPRSGASAVADAER